MKRIKFFLFLLFLPFAFTALAQEYATINVIMKDGSITNVQLKEQPKVTFIGDKLVITTSSKSLQFDRNDVQHFTYAKANSVNGVNVDKSKSFSQQGETLIFNSLKSDSHVQIYCIDGRLVKSVTASGCFELNLDSLNAGIYIVKVNGTSTKIILQK